MREPIRTAVQLAQLDDAEVLEGYQDGLSGEAEPGDNRSLSYWHGWRNGTADRTHKPDDAMCALIREVAPCGVVKPRPK